MSDVPDTVSVHELTYVIRLVISALYIIFCTFVAEISIPIKFENEVLCNVSTQFGLHFDKSC